MSSMTIHFVIIMEDESLCNCYGGDQSSVFKIERSQKLNTLQNETPVGRLNGSQDNLKLGVQNQNDLQKGANECNTKVPQDNLKMMVVMMMDDGDDDG